MDFNAGEFALRWSGVHVRLIFHSPYKRYFSAQQVGVVAKILPLNMPKCT